jgi:uncharacterized protein
MLLPKTIEPIRIAKQGAHVTGKLALNQCGRLQAICDQAEQQADVIMDLNMDPDAHVPFINGKVTATVNMICQRCNQPMEYALDISFLLSPVTSEKAAKALPVEYEPLVVPSDVALVSDIIEDEILLALPMVVKHEVGDC